MGYKNQVCVDFSSVVIRDMAAMFKEYEDIQWKVADVRRMSDFKDGEFDVAIDKSTLDAMIWGNVWNPPDEVIQNTSAYTNEVGDMLQFPENE